MAPDLLNDQNMRPIIISLVALSLSVGANCSSSATDPGSAGPDASLADAQTWLTTESGVVTMELDSSHLYFTLGSTLAAAEIARTELSQPAMRSLYKVAEEPDTFRSIGQMALGPTHIVWVESELNFSDPMQPTSTRRLYSMDKAGGQEILLDESEDVRAFLGISATAEHVYFSTFTRIYRIPVVGGETEYIATSPGTTTYWVYSPVVVDDTLYWASNDKLYDMDLGDLGQTGSAIAELPNFGKISEFEAGKFLIEIGKFNAGSPTISSLMTMERDSSELSTLVELQTTVLDTEITAQGQIFAATDTGLFSANVAEVPDVVNDAPAYSLAHTLDFMYIGGELGISRKPLL